MNSALSRLRIGLGTITMLFMLYLSDVAIKIGRNARVCCFHKIELHENHIRSNNSKDGPDESLFNTPESRAKQEAARQAQTILREEEVKAHAALQGSK